MEEVVTFFNASIIIMSYVLISLYCVVEFREEILI